MLLYLHGFQSSPVSLKAKLVSDRMRQLGLSDQHICPQLPESPEKAIELAQQLMSPYSPSSITLIGSSLGGYYANWLAEQTGCRAVLLNPVIDPWQIKLLDNATHNSVHVEEWWRFVQNFEDELKAIRVDKITQPERYFLLAARDDEFLDWEKMSFHYEGARQFIIENSDHGISDFQQYLDMVLSFCGVDVDKPERSSKI